MGRPGHRILGDSCRGGEAAGDEVVVTAGSGGDDDTGNWKLRSPPTELGISLGTVKSTNARALAKPRVSPDLSLDRIRSVPNPRDASADPSEAGDVA